MAQFINFEVDVDNKKSEDGKEVSEIILKLILSKL